ncbi:MAG: translation elongation factor G [Deltaproteobacteria bacterium RBG_19FT_COMBO_60_16]|nr:MAG: translation elongation factor G [Deltaproteobacteria bacterium RBG_16_64_85]OGQ00607.1 MAG: translation elongation factor G [Deltaproteobacteria bacterium RBG_19FT_COMBO_60_16]
MRPPSTSSGVISDLAAIEKVRNIGIIAHIDAGKTTFTERVLFYAGVTHRMGEVHEGDAQMDYLPQERERGITITAAVTQFSWLGAEVHLIDTPGHVDFTIEVERSLRVLDAAVVIFEGVAGVEAQSEVVWRQADRHRVPRLAFINKIDRPGADFDRVIAEMKKNLGARGVPVTVPLFLDGAFRSVADLLTMERLEFSENGEGSEVRRAPLSDEEKTGVARYREALLEAAADADDAVAEKFLAGEEIPLPLLRGAVRKGTIAARFFPVYAGAALRNKGIQPVMDGIVHFLPSPVEAPPMRGDNPRTGVPAKREPSPQAPFSALVFKVLIEEGRRTVYLRVYSGKVSEGDVVYNATTGGEEKIARLFRIHAAKKERIEEARAGDIVGAMGVKSARTGDTLSDPKVPIVYESIEIRKPVVSIAVEPRTLRDMDRLRDTLDNIIDEDPTLSCREDADTGQILLSGMGELHLEVLVERLARDFGLAVRTGKPQVVYRETVSEAGEAETVFEREIAERLVSVKIALSVRPAPRGSGVKISDRLRLLSLPQEAADAVEQGVREGTFTGILGYPVDDVTVEVSHVEFLSGTASPLVAKVAAVRAFLIACEKGRPYLLEPIMEVEIHVPDEFLGGVIGDINSRRGRVTLVDRRQEASLLSAQVPLKEMFGYVTALRSLSQGRGTYLMKFSHYDRA